MLSYLVVQTCASDNIITIMKIIIDNIYWVCTMITSYISISSFNLQNNAEKYYYFKLSSKETDSRPTLMLYCLYCLVHPATGKHIIICVTYGTHTLRLKVAPKPRYTGVICSCPPIFFKLSLFSVTMCFYICEGSLYSASQNPMI